MAEILAGFDLMDCVAMLNVTHVSSLLYLFDGSLQWEFNLGIYSDHLLGIDIW